MELSRGTTAHALGAFICTYVALKFRLCPALNPQTSNLKPQPNQLLRQEDLRVRGVPVRDTGPGPTARQDEGEGAHGHPQTRNPKFEALNSRKDPAFP